MEQTKFGKLTVLKTYTKDFGSYKKKVAICECECGNVTSPNMADIKAGKTLSCGCYKSEVAAEKSTTHGLSKSPLYSVWADMIRRCTDENCKSYPNYGKRGIKVCKEWINSVETFIMDMQETYAKGLDIDRIDTNGDYCKSNCKWSTRKENLRNKRKQQNTSSKYKGVSFHITKAKWTASFKDHDGKTVWLKRHDTEIEAARISYMAHKEYYGFWPKYCEDHLIELGLKEE